MSRGKLNWKTRLSLGGFLVAAILFLLVGLLALQRGQQTIRAAESATQSQDVLKQLGRLLILLQEAESNARGFALTGSEHYRTAFQTVAQASESTLAVVRQMVADNPAQTERAVELEKLAKIRLEIARNLIETRRRHGLAPAGQFTASGEGKEAMDDIRHIVAQMTFEESSTLENRLARRRAAAFGLAAMFAIFFLLSGGLLLLAFFSVRRSILATEAQRSVAEAGRAYADSIVNTVREPLIVLSKDLCVLSANRSYYLMFGGAPEDTEGRRFFELRGGLWNIPALREQLEKVLPQNTHFDGFEVEHEFPGLGRRTLLCNARKTYRVGNNTQSILLAMEDITERKLAEEELLNFFNLSLDLLCIAGFDGYFKRLNPEWQRVLGFTVEELTSRPYLEFIHPDDREATVREAENISTGATVISFENRYCCKDGSYRWLLWKAAPDLSRKLIYAAARDMTERKQTEDQLRRAKEEAESVSRFKDQFLSTMSHELRTPLNAVMGFSELLTDERYGPLNDRQKRFLEHVRNGGQHLLRLINDILDLSRIEAGRLELHLEELPVPLALEEVAATLRLLAEKKRIRLQLHAEDGLRVRGDAVRLRQVLINLVGNAIKFTPDGGEIELAARRSGDHLVEISVRDTGPGISPEDQVKIFEPFVRAVQSGTQVEGTGLGLAISCRLVELQGGQLRLDSEPGRGSRFYFALPSAAAERFRAEESESVVPAFDRPQRVLIIEDDADAAQLIAEHLSASGYESLICTEPQQAVARAISEQPDAITLDILMKPTNGWEILSRLKNDMRTSRIPVVLLTVVDEPALGAVLGADDFVLKPFRREDLRGALDHCLSGHEKTDPQLVLVVEDDVPTRDLIVQMLTEWGIRTVAFGDGREARVWMQQNLPTLVLLDLMLPGASGFELLAEWRAEPRLAHVPVLVLSAKDLAADENRFLLRHSQAIVHKGQPWQQQLAGELRRILSLSAQKGGRV